MVEMLMATFILAIGILGLAMLQTYALRSQTGSKSLDTAVQVGQRILDQAEMLGRNSVNTSRAGVTPPTLNPNYFGTAAFTQLYDYSGLLVTANGYYTATITPVTTAGAAAPGVVNPIQGIGGIAMVTVVLQWTESLKGNNTPSTPTVTLFRRINYAIA